MLRDERRERKYFSAVNFQNKIERPAAPHTITPDKREMSKPSMTKTKAMAIVKKRQQGFYITEETRDEVRVCLEQMAPTDQVITLLRRHGVFNGYDKREWLAQVADWKAIGAQCLRCNIRPIAADVGLGDGLWMMVIQPEKGMDGFCPLASAMGVLVSGFTYIAKDKAPFELAWAVLGRKE